MVIYIILLYIEEYPGLPDRTDAFLLNLYRNRVRNIFECAIDNSVDILVLGAFGCGAFQNPPYQMARAFCEIIRKEKYYSTFSVIAFAIQKTAENLHRTYAHLKMYFFKVICKQSFREVFRIICTLQGGHCRTRLSFHPDEF